MVDDSELSRHVDDVLRAVGNKAGRDEIEKELENYLNKKVPVEVAKQGIVKKYGGNVRELRVGVRKTLEELKSGEKNVDILCRVVSVNKRNVTVDKQEKTFLRSKECKSIPVDKLETGVSNALRNSIGIPVDKQESKDSCALRKIKDFPVDKQEKELSCGPRNSIGIPVDKQEKTIFYGILGDQTGTKPFTAWDDFNLNKNDVTMIHNAYTTEYQGIIQVNLGKGASVTKESQDRVPSVEYKGATIKGCTIADFREGLRNISVEVKIVSVQERKINVKGMEKEIYSGVLGDETGKARFTAWHDFGLKENDTIKIAGGYIKTNRGRPELNFDEKARVEKIEKEINVTDRRVSISELTKIGGGLGIVIDGVILDVKNGSGLIFRCPECKRSLQKGVCVIHGKVEGVPDLRTKAVVDDGTGALSILFGREITEKILGKNLEECKKTAQEKMSTETITDELTDKLLTKNLEIRGYTLKDDYDLTLIASDAVFLKKNVKEEAKKMLEELI